MQEKIKELFIREGDSIFSALERMDKVKRKLLIVAENNMFKSLLSIGDIQRAIINNVDVKSSVQSILRSDVKVSLVGEDINSIKQRMKVRRNEFMPIVSEYGIIMDVIFWEDLFIEKTIVHDFPLNLPVVIMAGGQGSRLRPLTNVLPKPLIPIGNQTMVEDIMDHFLEFGCSKFYFSINYKAEFIKLYFKTLANKSYDISFFQENSPLGTAGSLHLLKGKITTTFFVSNCDIIINEDYTEILKYHQENKNEITIVGAIKHFDIPYGTLETCENGLLKNIEEKPIYSFKINTGFYILEPYLIDEIPLNQFYHITTLIDSVRKQGRKVGVFPISEGAWIDIGNWNEYFHLVKQS